MKNRFTKVLIVIFMLMSFMNYAQENEKYRTVKKTDKNGYQYEIVTNDPTSTRHYTLNNGLKVYLAQNFDEPRVYSIISVKAGSAFEPADNTGLAHYLEHIMFNGNSKIGALDWENESKILKQIEELFEQKKLAKNSSEKKSIYKKIDSLSFEASKISSGLEYRNLLKQLGVVIPNGITNVDHTIYTSLVPATAMEKFLNLEAERFSHMVPRSFNSELQIVYEEFNKEMDDIWEKKYYAITEKIFEKHPYGQQRVIGTSEHLRNPSIKAIKEYFNKYYVPNNMSITLVGDLDFDNTILLIDKTLGQLKPKKLERPKLPIEDDINDIRKLEFTDENDASVYIAFRYKDANSIDEKYVTIIDLMLANGSAGFFDTELKSKQRVKDAKSYIIKNRDYGIHLLDGYPKQNQTLKEVENLLIDQIDKIKNGDFEDWLLDAIVNRMKIDANKDIATSRSLASVIFTDYIQDRKWEDRISYITEIQKITKHDIIDFANKFYNNYVVLYKHKGKSKPAAKVEKQTITPLFENGDKKSDFANNIEAIQAEKIVPEFLDFNKYITKKNLKNDIDLFHVENKKNSNFELHFIYNVGSKNIRKLPLAIDYIKKLGTKEFSKTTLSNELFKNGLKINFSVNAKKVYISISGIEENLSKGIELASHILLGIKSDKNVFKEFIQGTNKQRIQNKNDLRFINYNLRNYALYSKKYLEYKTLKSDDILNLEEEELIKTFKDIVGYKLDVFYYGDNITALESLLKKDLDNFTSSKNIKINKDDKVKVPTKNLVYLVHKDGLKQANISFVSRTNKFKKENLPLNNLLNWYLSNTFEKEIREKRALFYSGYAYIDEATSKKDYDHVAAIAATQVEKLPNTLNAIFEYLNNLPFNEADFNITKVDLLKRFEASRTNGPSIFWTYLDLKEKEITNDINEYKYNTIKSITLKDLIEYYNTLRNNPKSILIVADKNKIDINELSKFGKVVELTTSEIFRY
ncbi:M16 family metallopeptidase [Polaribacter porphyrae]|nr:M16 family metallopeptidase [Polaribacter porphyrae]